MPAFRLPFVLSPLRAFAICLLIAGVALPCVARACPFCTVVGPTLSQQRDQADVVALGTTQQDHQPRVRVLQVVRGQQFIDDDQLAPQELGIDKDSFRAGRLLILLGTKTTDHEGGPLRWQGIEVDEVSAGYVFQAPATRLPAAERLAWLARWLEHPDALLAEDAYREFGQAPLDTVQAVADEVPAEKLQAWLRDGQVRGERKGLYGLMLGLQREPAALEANRQFLEQLVREPADDFRAGYDGIVGGYLMAGGSQALAVIEEHLLANPRAASGDVRHAITALRVVRQYGDDIPREQLARAMSRLLTRPDVAAMAIIDLARWQAWQYIDEVAALYGKPGFDAPDIERAIAGYMLVCPLPAALEHLARLEQLSPQRVQEAEAATGLDGR